jgi:acyl carrier protein
MDDTLRLRIKEMLVQSLRLPYRPSDIGDADPLFGGGLGLDSIDALEIVLSIERTFGVRVDDEQIAKRVLQSVNTIAEFITERRGGNFQQGAASVA